MALKTLLLVTSLLSAALSFSQDDCDRFLASHGYAQSLNHVQFIQLFKEMESKCNKISKVDYERLFVCYYEILEHEEYGSDAWLDTLESIMDYYAIMDKKGYYDEADDLTRGYYYTQLRDPNYENADLYLKRGIEDADTSLHDENYILLYYFNVYTLWSVENNLQVKQAIKERFISDFFKMSDLIIRAKFSTTILESILVYTNQVISSCDDFKSRIPSFIKTLPQEPTEQQKTALKGLMELMSTYECANSEEFQNVKQAIRRIAPNDGYYHPRNQKISIIHYLEIIDTTENEELRNKIKYRISYEYFKLGQYHQAYVTANLVEGELKGCALHIMGKSVAASAQSCGASTFERRCNYIYATELLEKAKAAGIQDLESTITEYKSMWPKLHGSTNNVDRIQLDCWGVSVLLPE